MPFSAPDDSDHPEGQPPRRGDDVRAEVVGRVVDVAETSGPVGVLVGLDDGGEVWLPLEAVTVQPSDPETDEPRT